MFLCVLLNRQTRLNQFDSAGSPESGLLAASWGSDSGGFAASWGAEWSDSGGFAESWGFDSGGMACIFLESVFLKS